LRKLCEWLKYLLEIVIIGVVLLDNKINILIPMAGRGARFLDKGFTTPKPFILINGKPMIRHVLEAFNVSKYKPCYIFVVREEYLSDATCVEHLENLKKDFDIKICVDKWIEGPAASAIAAHRHINNETPLLMSQCDEAISISIDDMMDDVVARSLDGILPVFQADGDRWGYVKTDADGLAVETAEKRQISRNATVGWFFFTKGKDFVSSILDVFAENNRVNNEFYVCPCYNHLIKENKRIGIMHTSENERFGLGTPEEVERYINKMAKIG